MKTTHYVSFKENAEIMRICCTIYFLNFFFSEQVHIILFEVKVKKNLHCIKEESYFKLSVFNQIIRGEKSKKTPNLSYDKGFLLDQTSVTFLLALFLTRPQFWPSKSLLPFPGPILARILLSQFIKNAPTLDTSLTLDI